MRLGARHGLRLHSVSLKLLPYTRFWQVKKNSGPFQRVRVDDQRGCLWVTGRPQTSAHTRPSCRGSVSAIVATLTSSAFRLAVFGVPAGMALTLGIRGLIVVGGLPPPNSRPLPPICSLRVGSAVQHTMWERQTPCKLTLIALKSASLLNPNTLLRTHLSRSCTKI